MICDMAAHTIGFVTFKAAIKQLAYESI